MPDGQNRISSFGKRLWLASERDQLPDGAMRRCVGAAGEPSENVVSRYGSSLLYQIPNCLSLTKYNGVRYQYDGANLYRNGVSIDTGYNGDPAIFVKAPPALGVPDYLFLTGGGKFKKVDPSGTVTNWGIAAPQDGMVGQVQPQDNIPLDTFDGSAASWTASNCAISNNAATVYDGAGSLKIVPTSAPWSITKDLTASPLNLSGYPNGDLSLQTDIVSLWLYVRKPTDVVWLWIMFDVDDGTFKRNYYRLVVQIVSTSANVHAANADVILAVDSDRWVQIAAAKSQFNRVGTDLFRDWSRVKKIRIEGGNVTNSNPAPAIFVDKFEMYGGAPLGAGPAALSGGSTYKYLVTFGNDVTGNDSNPNDTPLAVNNVALQTVLLTQIPVSSDPQVTNRKLWRTTAGGGTFFLLDTIRDNTTTTYTDRVNDLPGQPWVVTPWQKNADVPAIAPGYTIDGGDGMYFQLTASFGAGLSGATIPTWNVPNESWGPLESFDVAGEVILPRTSPAHNSWRIQNPGITGKTEPDWTKPSPITDGTVVWVDNGPLTTTDNPGPDQLVWTCFGTNAQPSLDITEVKLDNTVFPSTAADAAFFQGSMFVSRDSTTTHKGWVFVSPPGRSEGYGTIIDVSTDNDPVEKLIVWDERLWALTQQAIYELRGSYPAIAPIFIQGAIGTVAPFTAVATPYGIVRQCPEDIRIFNNARDVAMGFEAIAPIQRGQPTENVNPFIATRAEHTKDEILFSDGTVTFGYSFVSHSWRMIDTGLNALYYEDDTGIIQAATADAVVSLEDEGTFVDFNPHSTGGAPINIEWQTPSVLINSGSLTFVKRVMFKINCNNEVLIPTILVDANETTMPAITNSAAGVVEIPYHASGYRIGFRLSGSVSSRVEWSGVDWDVR